MAGCKCGDMVYTSAVERLRLKLMRGYGSVYERQASVFSGFELT